MRRLNAICSATETEIAKVVGLQPIDMPLLASIIDEPGMSVSRLAEWLGIERGAAGRSLKRLERRGFVVRCSNGGERRLGTLSPTAAGIEARLWFRSTVIVAQDRLTAPLSEHERETFKDLLSRVIEVNSRRADE